MSDSLTNYSESETSRSTLTESVPTLPPSTSDSTAAASKEPETFQYTDDQFIFQSQSSGDNKRSAQFEINFPKEHELPNVNFSEVSNEGLDLHTDKICPFCASDDICRCLIKLDAYNFMRIQKPDPTIMRHYPNFAIEKQQLKSYQARIQKEMSKLSKSTKITKESQILFWFRFFGFTMVFTFLITCLSQLSNYILWKNDEVIPILLSGGIFIIGCCWLRLVDFFLSSKIGCQFSTFDYTVTIFCINALSIPWIVASFNLKLKFIYISFILLLTGMNIFGKNKETMSKKQRFFRKCLFTFQIVTCFLAPPIHLALNQQWNSIVFSFGSWFGILMAMYITALVINKFFSRSHIYIEMTNQIVLYEVLQVYELVYFAFSFIQYINMTKLVGINPDVYGQ